MRDAVVPEDVRNAKSGRGDGRVHEEFDAGGVQPLPPLGVLASSGHGKGHAQLARTRGDEHNGQVEAERARFLRAATTAASPWPSLSRRKLTSFALSLAFTALPPEYGIKNASRGSN